MQKRDFLIYLSVIYKGDWDKIYEVLCTKPTVCWEDIQDVCLSVKCGVITIFDEAYPEVLKHISHPPFVLFYEGDISLIRNTRMCLAVVGSRQPNGQFLEVTREIVSNVNKDITIISGLASGIDAMAHKAAIESGHNTVAVLGSGIDICYPSENYELYDKIRSKYLIISEYPMGVPPEGYHFPQRNRIISGLSHLIYVPYAALRSGSMITVSFALSQGKDVICSPCSELGNSGCNFCIKNGAYLAESAEDINEFFPH